MKNKLEIFLDKKAYEGGRAIEKYFEIKDGYLTVFYQAHAAVRLPIRGVFDRDLETEEAAYFSLMSWSLGKLSQADRYTFAKLSNGVYELEARKGSHYAGSIKSITDENELSNAKHMFKQFDNLFDAKFYADVTVNKFGVVTKTLVDVCKFLNWKSVMFGTHNSHSDAKIPDVLYTSKPITLSNPDPIENKGVTCFIMPIVPTF